MSYGIFEDWGVANVVAHKRLLVLMPEQHRSHLQVPRLKGLDKMKGNGIVGGINTMLLC